MKFDVGFNLQISALLGDHGGIVGEIHFALQNFLVSVNRCMCSALSVSDSSASDSRSYFFSKSNLFFGFSLTMENSRKNSVRYCGCIR